MSSLIVTNATLVLPDRELSSGSIEIEDTKISKISPHSNGESRFDLEGATLLPGFIDLHIHGAVGVDVMDASPAELADISSFLASQGVTSWVPTLVPDADERYVRTIYAVSQAMHEEDHKGAQIVGVHYEGPFVNSAQCGALHREHFKTYSSAVDLDRFPVPPVSDSVKLMTLAPEIDGGVNLIRELNARGWVVSIGHTRADVAVLDQSFNMGARHMTHFMNAMAPLHHRNPGPIAWGLMRDDVTVDMIADGIHLDPFMLQLLLKLKGSRGVALISDAIAATGKGDGDYEIWGETISVCNGRTSNAAGSIAGSVITMLDALRMMRSLGASNVDVAQMASLNPAKLLRLDHEMGSIEVGKRANLVALDNDGKVRLTIVDGRVVFQAAKDTE